MTNKLITLTVAAVLCSIISLGWTHAAEESHRGEEEFVQLYNGQNLDGWDVLGGDLAAWKADGELLSCVKEGGGWLRTNKIYSDFALRLEYRIPAGGNSGIGIRFPDKGNPAFDGMEIQVLDDDDEKYKDLNAAQYTGSLYYQAAAKRGASKPPGEWNSYAITCLGRKITIALNGKIINAVDLDKYTMGEGEHTPLADRPQLGHIGMQSHGSRVDFRKIQIKDFTKTTDSGLSYTDIKLGEGEVVPAGATVTVHYTGRFVTGNKFDSSRDRNEPATFSLARVIPGWQDGIAGMKVGGRRKLVIPPELAYGRRGRLPEIPPAATLIFDVEVLATR